MENNRDQRRENFSNFSTLPTELLVYIISFLTIRYVSRKLRSACEIPLLWREFVWPYFDFREECCVYGCVKSLLKSCGQFIKRCSFHDHVMPSKLTAMLQYCSNVVELSLPTSMLNPNQLEIAIQHMENLKSLKIPWTGEIHPLFVICSTVRELTITELADTISLDVLLTEWAMKGFIPHTLSIIRSGYLPESSIVDFWSELNRFSPTDHSGYFKVFHDYERPINLLPMSYFQLQFGQSSTLPLVRASKYGLLGLEVDILLLTSHTCHNRELHKAMVAISHQYEKFQSNHFHNDINNLSFITHFSVSSCQLHSGHLEQLAIACPNLMELNLDGNDSCLKSIQGLRMIAGSCRNLQGLNLSCISVNRMENYVQLWEILVEMKLTYLGIDLCALLPYKLDEQVKEAFVSLHQKCSKLKAIEALYMDSDCSQCKLVSRYGDYSLLSNFTSLVHLFADAYNHPTAIKGIVSCKTLKYFISTDTTFSLSGLFAVNCNLEQLSIQRSIVDIPSTFMQSISAPGGLVHVLIQQAKSVTLDGMTALIENSPNLLTFHVSADHIYASPGVHLKLKTFNSTMKKKFSNRKLFSRGSYHFSTYPSDDCLTDHCTELTSIWYECSDYRYW